jgi:hypothetical protein
MAAPSRRSDDTHLMNRQTAIALILLNANKKAPTGKTHAVTERELRV